MSTALLAIKNCLHLGVKADEAINLEDSAPDKEKYANEKVAIVAKGEVALIWKV